jgi:hypothetical protein
MNVHTFGEHASEISADLTAIYIAFSLLLGRRENTPQKRARNDVFSVKSETITAGSPSTESSLSRCSAAASYIEEETRQ